MGKPGPAPEVPIEDVRGVFDDRQDPFEPLTSTEIADALGCSRRTALDKLQILADRGDLESKKVGGRSRVWWPPARRDQTSSRIAADDAFWTTEPYSGGDPVDEEDLDDILYGEVEG